MNVSLTPELERLVNEKVESGLYQTASEVVREALRLLKDRDQAREQLRADVQAGFDQLVQGEGRAYDKTSAPATRRADQVARSCGARQEVVDALSAVCSRRAGPRADLVLRRRGRQPRHCRPTD